MTGSESIVLQNITSSPINLSNYVLQYFNSRAPSNLNVYTSAQALPSFSLGAGQSFLLSGDSAPTCGAAGVANLGFSLSDTSGYIQIVKVAQAGGVTSYTTQDGVNWTSGSTTPTDILHVPSATVDGAAVWYRKLSDGSWNQYENDATPCNLYVNVTQSSSPTYIQWANGSAAPSVIVTSSGSGSPSIPNSDIGLATPQITELLPNPTGTGNDSTDEFVELYNPNNHAFDLSGFTLESGLTTKHDFTFADGTSLPSKAFVAFYSDDTGLTLSNTGSEVWLLDPLGNIMSQSDAYSSAKDGQAWALANGTWYWTSTPTPNAPNLINGVAASSVKSKTNTTPIITSGSTNQGSGSGGGANSNFGTPSVPTAAIHPWTLAGVGAAALLYAGYEYRNDLANNLYRIRRYYAARRATGK